VEVVGEKESLTHLGREELLDDKVSKMGVLSRIPSDTEPLPEALRVPVAIAEDLVDAPIAATATDDASRQVAKKSSVSEISQDTIHPQSAGQEKPPSAVSPLPTIPSRGYGTSGGGTGGFLGFLQAYNNPLTRLTTGGTTATDSATTMDTRTDTAPGTNTTTADTANTTSSAGVNKAPRKLPGGLADIDAVSSPLATPNGWASVTAKRLYPMSTVLIVALVAFLLGSLLRSLLSPADFIYVVTDLREAEQANPIGGWREIRRLLELKYVVGGWDFQIAVVRRH